MSGCSFLFCFLVMDVILLIKLLIDYVYVRSCRIKAMHLEDYYMSICILAHYLLKIISHICYGHEFGSYSVLIFWSLYSN